MATLATSMTKKGQVTIPVQIRRALGLKPRDKVVFEIRDNEVTIRPAPSDLAAGFGAVTPKSRPEDFRLMRKEVGEWLAEEVHRELANG